MTDPVEPGSGAREEGDSRVLARRFVLIVIAAAVLYGAGVNQFWRYQRDSILYMGLARALATGGEFAFGLRPHTFVWPGFPALLAVLWRQFGENYLAFNVAMSLFGLGCVALSCPFFRSLGMPPGQALACLLLYAFNRSLYYYSHHILSDVPFAFFTLLGLYGGLRMLDAGGWRGSTGSRPGAVRQAHGPEPCREAAWRGQWGWCVVASAAVAAALFLRPLAPALLIALVAAVWLRSGAFKEWARSLGMTALLVLPIGAAAGLWVLRCARAAPQGVSYFGVFVARRGYVQTARRAFDKLPQLVEALTDGVLGVGLGLAVGAVLAALMAAGVWVTVRRRQWLLVVFGAVYLAATCLGEPGRRYLTPALPVLIYWLVVGAARVGEWLGGRAERRVVLRRVGFALLGLALAANSVRIGKLIYEARRPDFPLRQGDGRVVEYEVLCKRLRPMLREGDVILANEDRLVHYLTLCSTVHLDRRWQDFPARAHSGYWRKYSVDYVVSEPDKDMCAPQIAEIAQRCPSAVRQIAVVGKLRLYRVELDKFPKRNP